MSNLPRPWILRQPEGSTLFKNRRRLIVQLLSLVLLLAQLGMQAHAYSHLASDKHGVPASTQFCGECLSFAPLLGMADSAPCTVVVHHVVSDYIAPPSLVSTAASLPATAFRSRAPPSLL